MPAFYGNHHIENVEYGENITAPAYAYINPSDGKMYKASASTTAHPANGLVFASGSMGDIGQILFTGVIEWDFLTPISAASVYYLSNTAGAQTTTAPTNKQHLAYAVSSTRLYINPQPFAEADGGGGGGVASVTGPGVDNTDAANPEVSARPYKVYSAFITQSGTDAPMATILENTFSGDIVWTYNDVGSYTGTLSGAFAANKTLSNYSMLTPYINGGDALVYATIARNNVNEVSFLVLDATLSPSEANVNEMFLEIRVY